MVAMIFLLSTASVIAQQAKSAEPHTASQVVDFWVTNTEQLLISAADAMPESRYSFAPSNGDHFIADIIFLASNTRAWGQKTAMSASAPARRCPFLGNRPKCFAGFSAVKRAISCGGSA